MAKVKITGHASGSGVVTVTAPNTSTDRTITLPDATATIATTTDVAARLPSITDNGNATAITIDSSENVGIGVTDPASLLTIGGNGNSGITLRRASASNRFKIFVGDGTGNTTADENYIDSDNTSLHFRVGDASSATEVLNLKVDGRGLSQFTAKAWANFNGEGTVALRDSHNVSSLTDNGTGDYSINFSNNMANTSYVSVVSARWVQKVAGVYFDYQAVGSTRIATSNSGQDSHADSDTVMLVVFGD